MSQNAASPDRAEIVTAEGMLLSEVYGRLVGWHHTLATVDSVTRDIQLTMMRDVMDTLKLIQTSPQFHAADAAEQAEFDASRR